MAASADGSRIVKLVAISAVIAGVLFILFPDAMGLSTKIGRAAGVVMIAVSLWATAVVPAYFTAILFMFLAVVLAIAPPQIVFSGFLSTAVWLVFGGLVLGVAVAKSGLGARAVSSILSRFPLSYRGLIWALVLTGIVLGLFIPSASGRVVLLMPIVIALADRMGFTPGRPGRTGMMLATGLGTTIPAFAILPANVPNISLVGSAESIYGIRFSYGEYLLLNFPILGLLGAAIIALLICRLFPDTADSRPEETPPGPWSSAEKRLILILVIGLGLWVTDFWHGVSPAWVALGAAVLCTMPGYGVLKPTAFSKEIDYGPWIFVAGVIGLGAVVNHSEMGAAMAGWLLNIVPLSPDNGPATFATLFGVGAVTALVTTLPASPAILTPLAKGIADTTGWPLESVLMTQVPTWLLFALPYQAPPIVLTLVLGGVSPAKAVKVMLPYMIIGIILLLPLQYLWGRLIGVYP